MSLMKSSRFFAMCFAVAATPALADESGITISGQTVRLECPAGTVQNTGKVSKDQATYCRKTAKQEGKEPVLHGPYVAFWANGQKQSAGQYKDGYQIGRWSFWDANGVKTGETEFLRGNYHGTRVEFHTNGKKKLEQQWVEGKREGTAVAYSEDGQKVAEMQFQGDRMVKELRFENGKPVASK